MASIVSVHIDALRAEDLTRGRLFAHNMSYGRWLKMAAALARQGHRVDLAVPDIAADWPIDWGLDALAERPDAVPRPVPLSAVSWYSYDWVKTQFHRCFETLLRHGGGGHRHIVAKLGSVVAGEDRPGVYFYGAERAQLYATQERVAAHARHVTVLSEPAAALFRECHGRGDDLLLVPGAADAELPSPGPDPYPRDGRKRCLFAGNVYGRGCQLEANRTLVDKLNLLGARLEPAGARLFVLGQGDVDRLDPALVTHIDAVPLAACHDWLHHADVGIVVSAGSFMHNNENTKIYHYLRAGLPVVSERGFPNDRVVSESGGGVLVDGEDMGVMTEHIIETLHAPPSMQQAVGYVRRHHTWDRRAAIYRDLIV